MKKVLVILALLAVTGIASAELVTDGDFENGATGWAAWNNAGIADHTADYGGTAPNTDAGVWWTDGGVAQEVTGIVPGDYSFSIDTLIGHDAFQLTGDRQVIAQVDMFHWNDGGWWDYWYTAGVVSVSGLDSPAADSVISDGFDFTVTTNPEGDWTEMAKVYLHMVDAGGSGNGYWDNASITAVPEPATMALLGLGGLLLRRKK
ncbi:MAG: PEP-CTERM sorting domain-containing protein [Phycisphaerae bacterium]|nr:PEP-CTERM sorting domain-containing protein [Phycisphaerae bacterium]